MVYMNIFNKLEKLKLGNREDRIRELIVKDPDGFVVMGIEEVMEKSGASRATIYRLCDKLHVSGFADLRMHINKDKDAWKKANTAFDFNYPVEDGAAVQHIAENLAEDYEKTVMMTKNLLDISVLRRAALEMERAKAIDIYTSAGNIHFAKNFAFQMKEIGVDVQVPEELYLQKLSAASSGEGDFAIVISFGGRNWQMKSICEELKHNHTRVLLICSEQAEKLFPYADMKLYFASYEDHSQKISSFSTRLSLLYILDMLYTCYFERDYAGNLLKKKNYYRLLTNMCEDEEK